MIINLPVYVSESDVEVIIRQMYIMGCYRDEPEKPRSARQRQAIVVLYFNRVIQSDIDTLRDPERST